MARKTLSQRIALDGGKEIEAELKALGKAGEQAFELLKKAAADASSPQAKLAASMRRVKVEVVKLKSAVGGLGKTFQTLGRRLSDVASKVATVARRMTALTAAALGAAAAIAALARSGAKAAAEAKRTAEGLGLSTEQYTRLRFAASQSGVSMGQFGAALNQMNIKAARATKVQAKLADNIGLHPEKWADAQVAMATGAAAIEKTAEAGDKAAVAFKKLGVTVKIGGKVRNTRDILLDLAKAFKKFPDGVEEVGLAVAIFGESARFMLPFLNKGKGGIEALEREADRLGVTFTELQGVIGEKLIQAQDRLAKSLKGLKDQIGLLFAPALTKAADQQTKALENHRQALLDFVNAGVPKVVALVEDLAAALAGRDQDVRARWILTARDAIKAFAEDVQVAWERIIRPAFEGLLVIFDQIAAGINKAFGTDFTGRQVAIAAFVGVLLGAFSSFQAVLLSLGALILGLVPQALPLLREFGAALIEAFTAVAAQIPTVIAFVKELVAAFSSVQQGPGLAFGKGLSDIQVFAIRARDAILSFAESAKKAFETVLWLADKLAVAINAVFGTKLTGAEVLLGGIALKLLGVFKTLSRIVATVAGLIFIVTASVSLIKTALAAVVFVLTGIATAAGLTIALVAGVAVAVAAAGAAIFIFWDEIKAGATAAWNFVADGAQEAWRRIGVAARAVLGQLSDIWSALPGLLGGFADAAADRLISAFKKAVDFVTSALRKIRRLIAAAAKAAASIFSGGGAVGGGKGFVAGGAVTGPGTKTSDSIDARLSRGEFVIRAAAVDRYGPRLFAALNSLKLPTGLLPGFSLGGLVDGVASSLATLAPAPMPAFAMGGAVPAGGNSGRPLNLYLDGQRYPVSAEDSVAEALTRTALGQRRRRAGRMPGWFGGEGP